MFFDNFKLFINIITLYLKFYVMIKDKINELDEFLADDKEGTVCDINGNCTTKHIKADKSVLERIDKKIITEDGRQLLV